MAKTHSWPKNTTHFKMIDEMQEILKEEDNLDENGEIPNPELARKIGAKDSVSSSTARSYLSTHHEYLTEKEPFTRRQKPDGTAGTTTYFWSLDGDAQ